MKQALDSGSPAGRASGAWSAAWASVSTGRLLPAIVTLGALLLYLLTIPANQFEAQDSYWYAYDVETKPYAAMFYRHHLLYRPIMKVLYEAARWLGLADRSFPVMVAASVASGSLALGLFALVLRDRLRLGSTVALLGAAALGLSSWPWSSWRWRGGSPGAAGVGGPRASRRSWRWRWSGCSRTHRSCCRWIRPTRSCGSWRCSRSG